MQILKFTFVGAVGFFVDITLLYILIYFEVNFLKSRIFSFLIAIYTTWLLNSILTFNNGLTINYLDFKNFFKYLILSMVGSFLNLMGYYIVMISDYKNNKLLVATLIGTLLGFVANYISYKYFLFRVKDG